MDDGRLSVHGTAIAIDDKGLLITGPSGCGKSSLAVELLALGAGLISDDMVIVSSAKDDLHLERPVGGPPLIELRGIGLAHPGRLVDRGPLRHILMIEASTGRLPEPEVLKLLGQAIPILRHPLTATLAAKMLIWMRQPCS